MKTIKFIHPVFDLAVQYGYKWDNDTNNIHTVPDRDAMKLLRHSDMFEEVIEVDDSGKVVPSLDDPEPNPVDTEQEEEDFEKSLTMQEMKIAVSQMDKDALEEFAIHNLNGYNIDKRRKVESLREEVANQLDIVGIQA